MKNENCGDMCRPPPEERDFSAVFQRASQVGCFQATEDWWGRLLGDRWDRFVGWLGLLRETKKTGEEREGERARRERKEQSWWGVAELLKTGFQGRHNQLKAKTNSFKRRSKGKCGFKVSIFLIILFFTLLFTGFFASFRPSVGLKLHFWFTWGSLRWIWVACYCFILGIPLHFAKRCFYSVLFVLWVHENHVLFIFDLVSPTQSANSLIIYAVKPWQTSYAIRVIMLCLWRCLFAIIFLCFSILIWMHEL